jgi:DNA polymerase alpha subunit A
LKAKGELGVNIIYCTGSRGTLAENLFADSQLQEEMRGGQVELEKYIITKTLTKPPEDYPDAKNQPHVKVALRRKQSGHRIGCCVGDTVPYIICIEQGSEATPSVGIADRARHPDELKQDSGNWLIDIDYYISQQIHPVVSRLCAPIEGTDAAHIADCLGLDASSFHQRQGTTNTSERDEALLSSAAILDDDDQYRHCEPLELVCLDCCKRYAFEGVSKLLTAPTTASDSEHNDPLKCPACREAGGLKRSSPAMFANQVKLRAEEFVARYYDAWMMCDDEMCGHITRNVTLQVLGDSERGSVCPQYPGCNGHLCRQHTEVDLYKQLTHFYRLLDISRALDTVTDPIVKLAAEQKLASVRGAVDAAAQTINRLRNRCAFKWVQLDRLCITVN